MNLDEIENVILVASGKGGVGKTTITTDIAAVAKAAGESVGIIDSDISTPNSPEVIGDEEVDLGDQRLSNSDALIPPEVDGVQLVSQGTVLPDDVPLLRDGEWRARTVVDFVEAVQWNDDTTTVVIDSPPGTGEELQTVVAAAQPDKAYVVTTPHPSSVRDATKTHEFFNQMELPHSGILNMAYIPAADIASHVLDGVSAGDGDGDDAETGPDIADAVYGATEPFPLFGYDGEPPSGLDFGIDATVPYTERYESRAAQLEPVITNYLGISEVEA
jgi:ATP-binding protein involved in chromosome partitioning